MKKTLLFISVLAVLIICGCSNSSEKTILNELAFSEEAWTPDRIPAVADDVMGGSLNLERKVMKDGQLTFETENLDATAAQVKTIVETAGGYISNDQQYISEYRLTRYLELRLPSEKFDAVVDNISNLTEKIESRSIVVSDVTEEYLDVEARLKTKKELEQRYLALLTKANSVREILEIEREISVLRSDIESVEGRLKYLTDRISMSTLRVTFFSKETRKSNFIHHIGNGFKNGAKAFIWVFVGLIYIWPFIGVTLLIIYFLRRRNKKRRELK